MVSGTGPPIILLVEDDSDIRESVGEILAEAGYRVLTAAGGEEALRLLGRSQRPTLILLDLMMPGMNGWSFYKELRQDPLLASIPIVIFSAVGQIDNYADLIGAVGVLRKPVQVDQMLELVARHCDRGAAQA